MLSFVKIVKATPCSFNGMTWLLSLLTCTSFAAQLYLVGATDTNLTKSLKQRFTSNGQIQLHRNISYNWGFSIS